MRIFSAALTVIVAAGCIFDDYSGCPDDSRRYIRLDFSTKETAPTKSGEFTDHSRSEAALHSVHVWAFNSGNSQDPLGFEELTEKDISSVTDFYGNVSLIIPIQEDMLSQDRKMDFYIAANIASCGLTVSGDMSRSELEGIFFDNFSPSLPVTSVPPGGLPISRVVKAVDAGKYLSRASNPSSALDIQLVRAVSKFHFFFAQPTGLEGASISRIVIGSGSIPHREYLFSETDGPSVCPVSGYHDEELVLTPSGMDIHEYGDPSELACKSGESLEGYLRRLEHSSIGDFGLTYIKETPRALEGTIYYMTAATGQQEQSASFSLGEGKFARNREWIIYAFFANDRLYVRPVVSDWTDGGIFDYTWSYTNTLSNLSGDENTRILTLDGEQYLMAAWGEDPSHLPYSPRLRLDASATEYTGARMRLVLDNPDFGIIVDERGVLTTVMDFVEIELRPEGESVIFYVVPKMLFDLAGDNPPHPVARLRLLLVSDRLASLRLPFNAVGLPGDYENIRYHYVTADHYQ